MNKHLLCHVLLVALIAPFVTHAQDAGDGAAEQPLPQVGAQYEFQREGIFGCSVNGAYALGVAQLAGNGTFVPVNDAAITLNTGYLVYKECVLDGVTKRQAESAQTALVKRGITGYLVGRDGRPMFSVNIRNELIQRTDEVMLDRLQDANLSPMCASLKDTVRSAVVRSYLGDTRAPNRAFTCSLGGTADEQRAYLRGEGGFTWERFLASANPQNRPLDAFYVLRGYLDTSNAEETDIVRQQLTWGQGTYPIEEVDRSSGYTVRKTVTPGALVAGNIQQLLGAGFDNLKNATEIDQMVGSLFAGLSTQAITDTGGLAGIVRQNGSQLSYLDQLARESANALRTAIVNTGLTHLASARTNETNYLTVLNAIGKSLTEAIGKLRAAEKRCWELIIPAAQEYAQNNGFQISVATSTRASQEVIDEHIADYARATAEDIQEAQEGLRLINTLIAGLTNTNSLDAQRLAVEQLDNLVAQGKVHTQNDIQRASERKDAVQSALEDLISETLTAWGDNEDVNVGWCNVNNADVAKYWAERWR